MSLNGALSGINFSGIVSGLDTNSIIQKLLQVDQLPINSLNTQIQTIQTHQQALSQLATGVTAIQSAASSLSTASQVLSLTANSSDTSVATITSTAGAQAGTYNLSVSQLATAQKVGSAAQSSVSNALGLSGQFVVNGGSVQVTASDSLTSIAQKINGLNTGEIASVIDGGSGNSYLTIASANTGVINNLQLSDVTGGVLGSLGLLTGASTIRQPVTNGALGVALNSNSSSVGSLLGLSSPPAGKIRINGGSAISIDFNTDSLQTIANNINSSGSGVTASVQSSTTNGVTKYQLQIVNNTAGSPTFSDPENLLSSIGIVQQGIGNSLVAGQDANYTLDNVALTSASNTVTSAIPGATITLLKGTTASPGTSTLSLSTNSQGVLSNVGNLVTAYNAVVDYISQNSQLDTSTYQSGPLFADFTAEQVQQQLAGSLFNNIPGLTGTYTNLGSIGFSLDQTGHLQVDSTKFSAAVNSNPNAVAAIFAATGSSTNQNITYVSSSNATVSSATPYAVNISQAATQTVASANTQQTAANPANETLTFSGTLIGSNPYSLTLDVGSTLADTVNKINSDSTLKGLVNASVVNGALQISSLKYGTQSSFSVVSDTAAGSNNSGIGTSGQATITNGLDVAGTINGEAATGTGQFLNGNTGNSTTDGLQIQYTGTATGAVGSLTYSRGVASLLNSITSSLTDPVSGIIQSATNSDTTQVTDLNQQISDLTAQMNAQSQQLQLEFANMETAIAQLQQQSGSLSAITGSSSSSSSSSSVGKVS